MFVKIFNWVLDGLTVDDDDDEIVVMALLALLIAVVGFILLLPIALGDKREPARRRFWNHKWIYVVYGGIGLAAYLVVSVGMQPLYGGILGGLPVAGYLGTKLMMTQKGIAVTDVLPGGETAAKAAQPVDDDEFEVDMRVDRSSAGASGVPKLDKNESTAAIGASRSGKTSILKLLSMQLDYRDTAVLAHGSVNEYSEFYCKLGHEVIVLGVDNSTHRWNLFLDATEDRDFEAVARSLFDDDDYFERAGRQVFAACLKLLDREHHSPDHADIREMFQRSTATETYEKLKEHRDLRAAAEQLDPDATEQQRGVWSSVVQRVSDVFVGDFGRSGSFSFREYVQNPGGRVVVIESPELARGVGPGYALLIDEAIDAGMDFPNDDCFYLLDEVDTLPPMENIGGLASRGLARDCRMMLGIQTIGQLRDVYGQGTAGILGNCNQVVGLSPGNDDGKTVRYYQSLLGDRREIVKSKSRSRDKGTRLGNRNTRKSVSKSEKERAPITEHQMTQWDVGEGLLVARDQWWTGKFDYYERVIDRFVSEEPPKVEP